MRQAGERQKMELVANIMKTATRNSAVPGPGERLPNLLSDAANLSQFIRYSGLSQEMQSAVLRDAANLVTKARQLSPRSMGEISDMLSSIRPATGGVDATYGAAASLGETGSGSPQSQSSAHGIDAPKHDFMNAKAGETPFKPFSPDQSDFDMTIDNIKLDSGGDGPEEVFFAWANAPPLNPRGEGGEDANVALNLVLACMIGLLLFGLFAVLN
jgi:hypothetical protein